jgi:hypothetical protein
MMNPLGVALKKISAFADHERHSKNGRKRLAGNRLCVCLPAIPVVADEHPGKHRQAVYRAAFSGECRPLISTDVYSLSTTNLQVKTWQTFHAGSPSALLDLGFALTSLCSCQAFHNQGPR